MMIFPLKTKKASVKVSFNQYHNVKVLVFVVSA